MSSCLRLAFGATLLATVPCAAHAEPDRPQYVLISFDGAKDNALWRRSLDFADKTGARFTYFLTCANLLAPQNEALYKGPGMAAGRSNVGFGDSAEDVAARLDLIWTAHQSGHEIASHGCGHFDGKDWTAEDWAKEFASFSRIVAQAWKLNGTAAGEPDGWTEMVDAIDGFRAPYLSTSPGLSDALAKAGFDYDASTVSRGAAMPHSEGEIRHFALPLVPEGPSRRRIIAMDYNLFVRHSAGIERKDEGGVFEERAYRAFRDAFDRQYRGERVPLQIGLHFTLMNGGAYWRAMERLASEVCGRTDVRCTTYRDAAAALTPSGEITASTPDG